MTYPRLPCATAEHIKAFVATLRAVADRASLGVEKELHMNNASILLSH